MNRTREQWDAICPKAVAKTASPAAVMYLIQDALSDIAKLHKQADQLRAEIEELRKDKARLDAIEQECWDVRFLSSPNGDAGDSSISIEVVGHFMTEPCERVVGESYSENLRAAIDQAMSTDADPPVRPKYEEFEDLDALFSGGSGNKARRRAEALGIDYDAALAGKGASK